MELLPGHPTRAIGGTEKYVLHNRVNAASIIGIIHRGCEMPKVGLSRPQMSRAPNAAGTCESGHAIWAQKMSGANERRNCSG